MDKRRVGRATSLRRLLVGAAVLLMLVMLVATQLLPGGSQPEPSSSDMRDANWDFTVREDPQSEVALSDDDGSAQDQGSSGVADASTDTLRSQAASSDATPEDSNAPYAPHQVLLTFDGALTQNELLALLAEQGVKATDVRLVSKSLDDNGVLVVVDYQGDEDPEQLAQRLLDTDFVRSSGANYIETPCELDEEVGASTGAILEELPLETTPNDSEYSQQWGIKAMGVSTAWDTVRVNQSVTVAVLDSGVDTDHADLVGNLILDEYAKNTYYETTGITAVEDATGHGTHVSGIVAAEANNNLGVAGVSYNARILPIKVSIADEGTSFVADTIEAIEYVVEIKTNPDSPDYIKNIRVINLSRGGYKEDTTGVYQQAIRAANEAGIIVVAAAGNNPENEGIYYPAGYEGVVGVSAVKEVSSGEYRFDSSYSNYGSYVDLAAPGTNIYSTTKGGGYGNKRGTSMATPMVSGAAALLFAEYPEATPEMVEEMLEATAEDLGDTGRDDEYGYGLVRIDTAVGVRHLGLATIEDIPDQLFAPDGAKPEPIVSYGGTTLLKGTDYTVSYRDNKASGTATVVVTGKGSYLGTATKTFQIGPNIDRPVDGTELTYTGEEISVFPAEADGLYTFEGDVKATGLGTYTATVRPADGVAWSDGTLDDYTFSWTIVGMLYDLSGVSFEDEEVVYDGQPHGIEVTGALPDGVSVSYEGNGQTAVGSHEVTVHFAGDETTHQPIDDMVATLTILPVPVTVPSVVSGLTYDGTTQVGFVVPDDAPYQASGTLEAIDAGVYEVTVSLIDPDTHAWDVDGSPTDDQTLQWTIAQRSIADAQVGEMEPVTYGIAPLTPVPTVTLAGTQLLAGTDFVCSYRGNTAVGTADATITGIGNYLGSINATFSIVVCPIDEASVSFDKDAYTFTREEIEPDVTVVLGTTELVRDVDFGVSYVDNVLVGEATATITGIGNYAGTVEAMFTIAELPVEQRASIEGAIVVLGDYDATYTGQPIEPDVSVTLDGQELVEGLDYQLVYEENVQAGQAGVRVTGVGMYKDAATTDFEIVPRSIEDATADPLDDVVYSGDAFEPEPVVYLGTTALVQDLDYTLSYDANTMPGTATVTVTGTGNYTGTLAVEFEIAAAPMSRATIAPIANQKLQNGKAQPGVVVTDGDVALEQGVDYTVSYFGNTKPGTATVIVTGIGGYVDTASTTFTILDKWERIWGNNSYDTMQAILNTDGVFTAQSVSTVVLASRDSFQDPLAATALAGTFNAPLLLCAKNSLPSKTQTELKRLKPSRIIVVGYGSTVSADVAKAAQKAAGAKTLTQVKGTSAEKRAVAIHTAGRGRWSKTCVIATQNSYKDSLSASPYAYAKKCPIFFVGQKVSSKEGGRLSAETLSAIKSGGFTRIIIVGGPIAVSDYVQKTQLKGKKVERWYGSNGIDTSRVIAERVLGEGMGVSHVAVATTTGYVDALAGAALAGRQNSVVLLANKDGGFGAFDALNTRIARGLVHGHILGGPVALSEKSEAHFRTAQ